MQKSLERKMASSLNKIKTSIRLKNIVQRTKTRMLQEPEETQKLLKQKKFVFYDRRQLERDRYLDGRM